MAHDRSEVASGAPPLVTVEVMRKGGALLALQTYGLALVMGSILWVGNSLAGIGGEGSAATSIVLLNLAVLATGSALLWHRRNDRTELSAHGVRIVARRSDARMTWGQITELTEHRTLGSRDLWAEDAARPHRSMPVLSSGPGIWRDLDYEAKAQRIRDYWAAYRWSSFPPPGDRPPPPSAPS